VLGYYLRLALRSLKRNVVLTALMIAAVAVGIGACMTTLTVFRAMSGDPIPQKSRALYAVQIQNWPSEEGSRNSDGLEDQISYLDATALMQRHAGLRQSPMYLTDLALRLPEAGKPPTFEFTRAAYRDFFAMFDVPFKFGNAWSAADDQGHAAVVVLSSEINDKLFRGANSVGRTVSLNNETYRVVGVLDEWRPIPHFYDLHVLPFGDSDELFIPFTHAIDKQMNLVGSNSCLDEPSDGFAGKLRSECVWLQYWVELPDAHAAREYRRLLDNYAAEQRSNGRFHWPPHTSIRDVRAWLAYNDLVPSEVNILLLVSIGFLLVCLMNAMGLMLAKIMGRAPDIGVRRALGASRRAIFLQCLTETGVIGLAGGLAGLLLTAVGLLAARSLLIKDFVRLTHLDSLDVIITVAFAIIATMCAGLYPTWRAVHVQPAWQLKAQ
jgi:putative ABC transport system permease protein